MKTLYSSLPSLLTLLFSAILNLKSNKIGRACALHNVQPPALEHPVIRAWVLFQSEQNPAAGQKCCQNKHLYFQHIYDMDKCILFKEPFSAQSYFLVPTLTQIVSYLYQANQHNLFFANSGPGREVMFAYAILAREKVTKL